MQQALYCVGKMKGPLAEAAKEYAKRVQGFTLVEFREERLPAQPSPAEIQKALEAEGERMLAKIPPRAYVVVLDKDGEQTTSEGLEKKVRQWQQRGGPVIFIIGSSYGLSDAMRQRAQFKLSFSKMTFPHQLMRVLFLEQLYRAQTIRDGQTYHK